MYLRKSNKSCTLYILLTIIGLVTFSAIAAYFILTTTFVENVLTTNWILAVMKCLNKGSSKTKLDFTPTPGLNGTSTYNIDHDINSTPTSTTPGPDDTVPDVPTDLKIPQCGRSTPILGPTYFRNVQTSKNTPTTLLGEFPWMIALLKKYNNSDVWSQADYLGGGTLIHPSVVMTVAHKLRAKDVNFSPNELKCRAGEWNTQTNLELPHLKHQERNISKFIIHEDYYLTSLYNDIALLILEKPFQLKNAPHIGTACIATSLPPTGSVCYSMGWGKINPGRKDKEYAHILKKVLLQIVKHDLCQEMLRNNSRLGSLFELHESLMCATGSETVDTCRGDGGSSMVCTVSNDPNETQFAVQGLVAYATTCFNPKVPGLYADTLLLKSWVDSKMQEEGFDNKYYTM